MAENEKPKAQELTNVFTVMFRAIVRPAITIIFAAVIAEGAIAGTDFPDWFLALAIPCITWWFAERTVSHLKGKNGG